MTERDEMPDRFDYVAILLMAGILITAMVVWW